jgi:hypothetical protein
MYQGKIGKIFNFVWLIPGLQIFVAGEDMNIFFI